MGTLQLTPTSESQFEEIAKRQALKDETTETLPTEMAVKATDLESKQAGSALADHQHPETLAPSVRQVSTKIVQAIQPYESHSEETAKKQAMRSVTTETLPMAMAVTVDALQ